jgi:uncharacterized OB-fold protein
MQEKKLSGNGEIITFSIIHVGPEDFENQVPYPIAVIQLDEGPRLTAQIIDCEVKDIKIGMRVQSTFRKIREDGHTGALYYGYKFKPCNVISDEKEQMVGEEIPNIS